MVLKYLQKTNLILGKEAVLINALLIVNAATESM
jgi:hypothetical protein